MEIMESPYDSSIAPVFCGLAVHDELAMRAEESYDEGTKAQNQPERRSSCSQILP